MPGDPRTKSGGDLTTSRCLPRPHPAVGGPRRCREAKEPTKAGLRWEALPEPQSEEVGVLSLVPSSKCSNWHLPAGSCREQILFKTMSRASAGPWGAWKGLLHPKAPRR